MSAVAKALSNVTAYTRRWAENIAHRVHRIYDDRDEALADAARLIEQRSDSYYPAVVSLSAALVGLAPSALTGLTITGTNLIGDSEKASGISDVGTTKEITWTRVVPGDEDITVTIVAGGANHTVTAAWNSTTKILTVTRGTLATATEVETAIPLDAVAKFIVVADCTGTGGAGTPSVGSTTLTGGAGAVPILQVGATAIDGSSTGNGITSYTDTVITFCCDASGFSAGVGKNLRLWVDDVFCLDAMLTANAPSVTPSQVDAYSYVVREEEFLQAAGSTLSLPHAKDLNNNTTGDYLANTAAGVYRILHSGASEAQDGQLTWGDQLLINPTKTPIFEARFKIDFAGANFSADQRAVVGLCSAHANSEDSLDAVVTNAWFRVEGASLNIYVEADDGTHDTDDNDSGIDIVDNTFIHVKIDMTTLSAVKFYIDGVKATNDLNLSSLSASNLLQPIFCMQRDAGTEQEKLDIDWYKVYAAR